MHVFAYDGGQVISGDSFRYEVQFAPFRVSHFVDEILVNVMNEQDSLYVENSAYYHGNSFGNTMKDDCFDETAEYINGYFR